MLATLRRQRSPYLLLPAFLLTAGVFGSAMVLLFSYSAYTFRDGQLTEQVSFLAWQKFFGESFYWSVVGNTLRLALGVTLVALIVGYPTAYALTKVRDRRLLVGCYLVIFSPLLVSLVVRVYGWLLILSENGVINQVLRALGLIQTPLKLIYNDVGVTIALVHILLPFMVFPILSVLLQFDHTLREAAADLGANRLRTFARVVLHEPPRRRRWRADYLHSGDQRIRDAGAPWRRHCTGALAGDLVQRRRRELAARRGRGNRSSRAGTRRA